jgi:hypothetical protein
VQELKHIMKIDKVSLNKIIEQYHVSHDDPESFRNGCCAELATGIAQLITQHRPDEAIEITIIYRVEKDNDTDEELDRTLSHVILCAFNDQFDINGNNAYDNWMEHCDENIEPWAKNAYNDYEWVDIPTTSLECPPLALNETLNKEGVFHRPDKYNSITDDLNRIWEQQKNQTIQIDIKLEP